MEEIEKQLRYNRNKAVAEEVLTQFIAHKNIRAPEKSKALLHVYKIHLEKGENSKAARREYNFLSGSNRATFGTFDTWIQFIDELFCLLDNPGSTAAKFAKLYDDFRVYHKI